MDFKDNASKSFENREELRNSIDRALSGRNIESDEPAGFQTDGIYFGQQPPKMRADQYLQSAVGWVYGCVNRIADAVSAIDIRLYKIKGEDVEEVLNHKSLEVLDRINDFTTRLDHFHLSLQYLELAGEAPWYVSRGSDGKGEPDTMLLLRPDHLQIVQSTDPKSSNPIKEFKYRLDAATELTITPDELIFLKYPDPTNMFRGKGTLEAAAKTVDIDNFSEDYNKRFFYNSARPDMVLSSEQKLTSIQRQTLQSSIKKLYQGGDKAHKTLVLESGLKAAPYSLSQKDMDFLAQQNYDMAKIFSIFGVPKSIMSVSDDVNLANAKIGEYIFMKYTVVPKLKRIIAQLNEFYLPMFNGTEQMFFAFENPVPQDVDSKVKKYDSALGKGYMTYNEVRSEENLPDVGPAGDVLYIPFGITPIDSVANPSDAPLVDEAKGMKIKAKKVKLLTRDLIARSAGGFSRAQKGVSVNKRKSDLKKELNAKVDSFAQAMVDQIVKRKQREKVAAAKDIKNVFAEYGAVFLASSKNYERAFAMGMDTVFQEQLKKILKSAPKKSVKNKAINEDDWLLDEDEEAKIMVRVFSPLTKKIIIDSGKRAAKLAGDGAFNETSKPVQDYLKTRIFDFSFEVNKETNKKLGLALKDGVAKGESIPQLRERVSKLFGDMEDYRSERIARSEVVRAGNFAATEAYEQSGVVEKVQWLTTEDDRTDGECADLDGKTIDLGDSFFKKGDTIGDLVLDYGDVDYPPLHANCRCTVVPIVS